MHLESLIHSKMQSKMVDFVPIVSPLSKLDETYASSLIMPHSLHYVKIWRHLHNRKYI